MFITDNTSTAIFDSMSNRMFTSFWQRVTCRMRDCFEMQWRRRIFLTLQTTLYIHIWRKTYKMFIEISFLNVDIYHLRTLPCSFCLTFDYSSSKLIILKATHENVLVYNCHSHKPYKLVELTLCTQLEYKTQLNLMFVAYCKSTETAHSLYKIIVRPNNRGVLTTVIIDFVFVR